MCDDHPFPTSPEELTTQWLTEVLSQARGAPVSVTGHAWAPVAEAGAAGIVVRVVLDYDRAGVDLPRSVVIKFATPHAPIRAVMHRFGLYRAEVEFYRQLGANAGMPTPHCHAAEIDEASGHFVLVLEDLAPGRCGDPLTPRVDDVRTAIPHLARFHARWWGHPDLRRLDFLVHPDTSAYQARAAGLGQAFGGALGVLRQRLGDAFPAVLAEAGDRMLAHWPAFIAARQTATPTIVHRDFHAQQMFFPSAEGGRFAVFDWQTIAIGRGVEDLSRLLAMGLTSGDRRAHDEGFVAMYHAELAKAGVTGYGLAQCLDEFRLGLTASLITNAIAVATLDPNQFTGREAAAGVTLAYVCFDRLAAAFEAHDVLGRLPGA